MNNPTSSDESSRLQSTMAREAFVVALPELRRSRRVRDLFPIVAMRWKLLLFFALFGASVGLLIGLLSTTKYESSATLAIVDNGDSSGIADLAAQFGGLADLAGLSGISGSPGKAETLAVLRSRQLVSRFISDNDLMPILFPDEWDARSGKWKINSSGAPTHNEAVRLFSRDVRRINVDQKAGTIAVTVGWSDPEVAAEWCGKFVAAADELMRRRAISQARKNIEFLNARLTSTESADLRNTIARLVESQLKTEMLATTRAEYALAVVDPPVARDADDPTSPRKVALVLAGAFAGAILGLVTLLAMAGSVLELDRATIRE